MLEQQVIFIGTSANSAKDRASHEVIHVGSKAVDDLTPGQSCLYQVT